MPDVLLLCEYATLSGGEQSMLSTLDAVRTAGWRPTLVAPARGPLADAARARQVEVVALDSRDDASHRHSLDRLREELARLLRRRRPALLHANSLSTGRLSGPVAAELGLPSIAHLRDIVKLSRRAVADLGCHTRLLAVSEATRRFHAASGIEPGKLHVLYNGVDLRQFCPREPTGYLHRELGLPPEARLVGTIGQISLRKGQDVLLRAASAAADEAADLHYLVVGQRWSEKEESRRFEAELHASAGGPLAGRCHFLEFRNDVAALLAELTLLVHSARQEPLGRVLLEAAAAGLPVIATDVGGTREIFPAHTQSARLVPPDDVDAMAEAIVELAAGRSLRAGLGAAARHRAEEAFDVRQAAAALVEHYRQVAGFSTK